YPSLLSFSYSPLHHRYLPSFPTRRSSDLAHFSTSAIASFIGLFISVVMACAYSRLFLSNFSLMSFKTKMRSFNEKSRHFKKEHSRVSNIVFGESEIMINQSFDKVTKNE